MILPKSKNLII